MKFDENLSSIHAYLCADGYVTNPKKWKNYVIGLRNTDKTLLMDFQDKFFKYFGVKPKITEKERCRKNSKEIHEKLIKKFGSCSSKEWKMPKLNKKLTKIWLKSFFDCDGWVFIKTHQNRHIGLDSINEQGINQIISSLNQLGIKTIKKQNKKRRMFRIYIFGKNNLIKFRKEIGFLHPKKREKLEQAIGDYVIYLWDFPKKEHLLKSFIKKLMRDKCRLRSKKYIRIFSKEKLNLLKLSRYLKHFYNINCLLYKRVNGLGNIYYELNINKKEEIERLINAKLLSLEIIKCIKKNSKK